jgi:hypothetical protein
MRYIGFALIAGLMASGCGGSSASPAVPSPMLSSSASGNLGNLTGTWTGASADSAGQETMTWAVTQNGSGMSGTMSLADPGRSMMGNGSMQGTINGTSVSFHMSVPNGGFSGMMSSCSMGLDGQATISSDGRTMTGTYSGSLSGMMSGGMMGQSCGGSMNNGHFTLTR